jgi:hypothetical protein
MLDGSSVGQVGPETSETPSKTARGVTRRGLMGSAIVAGSAAILPLAQADGAAAERKVDVLVIGGGIMSATLAVLLRQLEPSWTIGQGRRGKLQRLEQRRYGPFRALRAELHADEQEGRAGRDREGDRYQRTVPGHAPVPEPSGEGGDAEQSAFVHQLDAAYEPGVGR